MRFFVGLHQPSDAKHVARAFISVNRLSGQYGRRSDFLVREWILDSGAFTTVNQHGGYPESVEAYAKHVRWWASCGQMLAAVAQDFMCEPAVLERTGLSIAEHQRLTIGRYDELLAAVGLWVPILPVLQGYAPADYVAHLAQYGRRLLPGHWVGVGSICKRNADPQAVLDVLGAIKAVRPDLRLHGFGLKLTALRPPDPRLPRHR
jgi:hypothetical protein